MSNKKEVELWLEVVKYTEKAFYLSDGSKEAWVPKSQLRYTEKPLEGDAIAFIMPEWIAVDKGFV